MKKSQTQKYGLLCYNSDNIGDEIQSLAAMRFLPQIDYFINRDDIDGTSPNTDYSMIINGWLLDPSSKDGTFHWPPATPHLRPLLISTHIADKIGADKVFKTPESIAFLKKYAPIGTRDTATGDLLTSLGVPNYFSGCLTLTLLPDSSVKKRDFILAVDISDDIYQSLQDRTNRYILRIDTSHSVAHSQNERMLLAKYWLSLYQSTHCVVTPRLHAMLPSLALGTPVIAISGRDPKRYSGLINLVNHYSEKDFLADSSISVDKPKPNPKTFHKLRDNIIKTCSDFTGYDSKKSYLRDTTISELQSNPIFIQSIMNSLENVRKDEYARAWFEKELDNKVSELESLKFPGTKQAAKTFAKSVAHHFKKS